MRVVADAAVVAVVTGGRVVGVAATEGGGWGMPGGAPVGGGGCGEACRVVVLGAVVETGEG